MNLKESALHEMRLHQTVQSPTTPQNTKEGHVEWTESGVRSHRSTP